MQAIIKAKKCSLSQHAQKAGLLASVAFIAVLGTGLPMIAHAQTTVSQTISFNIRAQNLGSALAGFADRAGLKLLMRSDMVSGKTSPAVQGMMTRELALGRLLSGSGLNYSIQGTTLTIHDPAGSAQSVVAPDGTVTLNTITVTNGGSIAAAEAPYHTAAPTSYISEQTIERFRGASPADIFRGTPGVMSGEARNGAGAIDVNIRGMQGMGRVATTIDGAENAINVYQGYQGISNRTFVDPDFLGGIDIQKGSDAASSGIAGTVAMRTIEAGDIVKEGNRFGLRVKGGFGTNSSKPEEGNVAGYEIINSGYPGDLQPEFDHLYVPSVKSSDGTMNRPAFLKPTNGSGSIVAAMQDENIELLAGYAYRERGNYHAGKNGPAADIANLGGMSVCSFLCNLPNPEYRWYPQYIENTGLANYRPGEQVLNTQLKTESLLLKGKVMFGDGHSIQLGYTGFESKAGTFKANALSTLGQQARQQRLTTDIEAHTGTFKYRWDPEENDLINLKANLWGTKLKQRNPVDWLPANAPVDFKSGPDLWTWGGDISNRSQFTTAYGDFDMTYGASYKEEDTKPTAGTRKWDTFLDLRDGTRKEAAAYIKTSYKPVDWLTVNGGLRYSHMWSRDRSRTKYVHPDMVYGKARFKQGGFSPSLGVTIEPFDGAQFYTNYSSTLRAPSIMEAVSAFNMTVNEDAKAERSNNWEIGANFIQDDLIADTDRAMLKLGYFNWDVKDYIAREFHRYANSANVRIFNIDRARFSGLEMSANYALGGFEATLAANYYLNVEFCRTAETCENKSLYADYATNQVPPKYGVDLTLTQKLLDDALTVGGRISYTASRASGHGDVTGQGMSQFITMINWQPYTLVDVFAEYKINDTYTASVRVENLTDRFYVDPLSLAQQPGPGRTFYASLTANF
ncbi:TonB-dependent receptor [Ochrobactrum sp. MR34]|nr:TonB-dependent receptor [Ochrobactrum sp. MR34]